MGYVFERHYVDENNKGYVRGAVVPADFSEARVRFLLADGIVKGVEGIEDFLQKVETAPVPLVAEDVEIEPEVEALDEVERLDPEKKRRKR